MDGEPSIMTDSPARNVRRDWFALFALLVFILTLWITTLREGHVWGDDFAHYIMQAENLARLESYVPKNYIVNPATSYLGPQIYPPGVSVVLAPVIKVFGRDFRAMKIWLAIWFVAGLVFLYLLSLEFLLPGWSLLVVVFFGLNPVLFESRDSVTPEKPYYLLSFALLWLLMRAYRQTPKRIPDVRIAPLIGLLLYFCYATRNLGVALFPVVGLFDLMKARRITRFGVISLAIGSGLAVLHTLLLGTASGYSEYFDWSPGRVTVGMTEAVMAARVFFTYPHSKPLTVVACLLVASAAIVGVLQTRLLEPVKLYLLIYGVIISAHYAHKNPYYLYPLVPFVGLYVICGIRRALEWGPASRILIAVFGIVIVGAYGCGYAATTRTPIREAIGDPDFNRMAASIRTLVGPNDVVMFMKPRLLAMVTERKSTAPSLPLEQEPDSNRIWRDGQRLGVTFLLTAEVPDFLGLTPVNPTLRRMVQEHQGELELAYEVGPYRLYRLRRTAGFTSSKTSSALPPEAR